MNKLGIFLIALIVLSACSRRGGDLFNEVPGTKSGLNFTNQIVETDDLNILDYLYFYNGGGTAVGDINNDGLSDIFLSANQGPNQLFLNKGGLKFENISESAGITGNSDWNTGAVMIDINADGLLDIYVNAVVGINGFDGHNELFINNGDNTFSEQSGKYNLDLDTYSSGTAFLDYDKDGDLDLFILNHAVHTQNSFGNASLRNERNYETGDRLMRNDGGTFTDVSEEAGIYGGVNGYGLGVAVSDFNQDGWPDIYVGNDFHEDDYYYLNQKDGSFKECLTEYFGHTSRFSMGNDVADINHDGWPDLISLDMLPEDEKALKSSEGDDNIQTLKMRTQRYGYHYQFTRNMLFVNQRDSDFMETALMSGVAATDWSWSAIFEDFNLDGYQDLYISNGIPKRPNDLDFIRFVSSEKIKNKINETKLVDQEAFKLMPSGKVHNYVFQGSDDLKFIDRSGEWVKKDTLVSGATAFGDLDNDGDLDLVINNLNSEVTLLENISDADKTFLKLKFKYRDSNPFGIGTKVFLYAEGKLQYKELYTVRGFQASSEPVMVFGLGNSKQVDSLKIIWPDDSYQVLKNIDLNQEMLLSYQPGKTFNYEELRSSTPSYFQKLNGNLGIDFTHEEDRYLDFNRQKLIPYMVSDRGPAFSQGDLNGDGKHDLYFGSSKFKNSAIYIQSDSGYVRTKLPGITKDSIYEEVSVSVADFNNDGLNDVFVGTGGADFYGNAAPLLDLVYRNADSLFIKQEIPDLFGNASVVIEEDYDQDGDIDLFVGNNMITNDYGKIPESYLLINTNGSFKKETPAGFSELGMVTHAIWSDFNQDGSKDLIVVGEWMSPRFFANESGTLKEYQPFDEAMNGLWQSIAEFDIDADGDPDYMLANWGSNSKFRASSEHPLRMYYHDFDDNGQTETIVANAADGEYYPVLSLDELGSQMVSLRKRFTTYKEFAGKPMKEIFDKNMLTKASVYEVQELRSGYLRNDVGKFSFVPFANEIQTSPLRSFLAYDFDGNGTEELLVAGNYFGVTPYHGRFDSFHGALILNESDWLSGSQIGLDLTQRSVRHLSIIESSGNPYLLVTFNNDKAQVYTLNLRRK